MSNELQSLETWANVFLAKLEPAQRRQLNRQIATELRRSQAQRIASQRSPDGQPYVPRKRSSLLRNKRGHIQRQKPAMFQRIRMTKHLKSQQDPHQISMGFFGRVVRIARVHQEGLRDRVSVRNKATYLYPRRTLLGFNSTDRTLIREVMLQYFISN